MNEQDRERMNLARSEAEKARAEGEIPVGAALYRGDTLLWADHNRREQMHDPTAHAEMLCMQKGAGVKGDWRLNDCTLYVTLEPCPMCAGAIVLARVKTVVWGVSDPKRGGGSVFGIFGHPGVNHRPAVVSGVRAGEAKALLVDFFSRRRRGAPAR